jgi:hypothetical protein
MATCVTSLSRCATTDLFNNAKRINTLAHIQRLHNVVNGHHRASAPNARRAVDQHRLVKASERPTLDPNLAAECASGRR